MKRLEGIHSDGFVKAESSVGFGSADTILPVSGIGILVSNVNG